MTSPSIPPPAPGAAIERRENSSPAVQLLTTSNGMARPSLATASEVLWLLPMLPPAAPAFMEAMRLRRLPPLVWTAAVAHSD